MGNEALRFGVKRGNDEKVTAYPAQRVFQQKGIMLTGTRRLKFINAQHEIYAEMRNAFWTGKTGHYSERQK